MNPQEILTKMEQIYTPLSIDCKVELANNIQLKSLKKGTILVKEGMYANKVYYLITGCARAYYLKDGKDISDWFAFEDEFISSIVSFFGGQKSPHYIELLEDAVLLEINKQTIEKLSNKYHEFERLSRIVVTKTMLSQQERISSILFHSAEERYQYICTNYPKIINRVALTHIASYLGITLETLSRIRRPKKRI